MQGQALRTFPSFLLAAVPLSKAWPPCAKFWFVGMTTYKSDLSTGMFYSIEEWLGTVSLLLFLFFSLSVLPHPPPPPLISDLSLPPSFSLSLSLGVITTRPISTWSLIIHTRSFLSTLLSSPPLCSPISVLIYHSWQRGGGGGWRWRVTCEERKMTTRRTQGGRKWETGERDWKLVLQSRRKDSRGEEIREGGESSNR